MPSIKGWSKIPKQNSVHHDVIENTLKLMSKFPRKYNRDEHGAFTTYSPDKGNLSSGFYIKKTDIR